MRTRLIPYNMSSRSGQTLARAINVLRVNPSASRARFRANDDDLLINWGLSAVPEHLENGQWINHPEQVAIASNKINAFHALQEAGVLIPAFTTNQVTASDWLAEGRTVVVRRLTRANQGRGIQIITPESRLGIPGAPLYTMYIPKRFEYRVHVLPNGGTIVRQKRRDRSVPNEQVDWRIRNHSNGFVFAQSAEYIPAGLEDCANNAVRALGLDFGAVDLIYNQRRDQVYVLEVNTAPGMEGETVEQYRESFSAYLRERQEND